MRETMVSLTDGSPVPEDRSHEEDRGDGQQKGYVILKPEERQKGFIRPVRDTYRHVGIPGPKYELRDLTEQEISLYGNNGDESYVKYEEYPQGSVLGRYWTQKELDRVGKGCNVLTTMGKSIAETYARDPTFYSGTFCCGCGKHFEVGEEGEFVWLDGTRVGT